MNGGELRSFNGDGVLVVFSGNSKCTSSVKTALQLSWFSSTILRPKMQDIIQNNQQLRNDNIEFNFGIGIDVGNVLIVRGGIRGENNNDLVWVGNATNYAVKLSNISEHGYNIYISNNVYSRLNDSIKYGGNPRVNIWRAWNWTAMNMTIYKTSWYRTID